MTKDEALKLALEAIEFVHDTGDTQTFDMCYAKPALAAIKKALAQPEQEPVGYVSEGEPDRLIAQKQTKTPLRNYRLFTHDVPLYTTPHTKVGCVECRVSGGHAFYCVACSKKLFGGYKESESFDRTASHIANEYVEYKERILTDAEISESYYEVFKTAMIDIKAFEFAYSLLRKAQEK
jgi:hypothetical protein